MEVDDECVSAQCGPRRDAWLADIRTLGSPTAHLHTFPIAADSPVQSFHVTWDEGLKSHGIYASDGSITLDFRWSQHGRRVWKRMSTQDSHGARVQMVNFIRRSVMADPAVFSTLDHEVDVFLTLLQEIEDTIDTVEFSVLRQMAVSVEEINFIHQHKTNPNRSDSTFLWRFTDARTRVSFLCPVECDSVPSDETPMSIVESNGHVHSIQAIHPVSRRRFGPPQTISSAQFRCVTTTREGDVIGVVIQNSVNALVQSFGHLVCTHFSDVDFMRMFLDKFPVCEGIDQPYIKSKCDVYCPLQILAGALISRDVVFHPRTVTAPRLNLTQEAEGSYVINFSFSTDDEDSVDSTELDDDMTSDDMTDDDMSDDDGSWNGEDILQQLEENGVVF